MLNNTVLSFAFLTMNGHREPLISVEELESLILDGEHGDLELLEKCLGECEFYQTFFNKTNKERAKLLQENCEKNTLPESIHHSYTTLLNGASPAMGDVLKDKADVKLLIHELQYENAVCS